MKQETELLAGLGRDSLVQVIPGLDQLVLERGRIRTLERDQLLVRAGDDSDELHILLRGELLLRAAGPSAQVVGRLIPTRALALRELLEGESYRYAAVAAAPSTIVSVPAQAVLALLKSQPGLHHYLSLITRSSALRAFRNFLRGHVDHTAAVAIFQGVRLETLRIPAGEVLASPGLYFLQSGALELSRPEATLELGEGVWVGGQSLVPPHQTRYRLRAQSDLRVFHAPVELIAPLLQAHQLLDPIFDEPGLGEGPADDATALRPPPAPFPGSPLAPDALARAGYAVDTSALLRVRTDADSVWASLANVALLLGVRVNVARIRSSIALRSRLTPLCLAEELEGFDLMVRAVDAQKPESPARLPALAFIGPRLVVVYSASLGQLLVHDPVLGAVSVERSALAGLWDQKLLEVAPIAGDDSQPRKLATGRIIRAALRAQRAPLFNLGATLLLGLLLALIAPLFMRYILDEVLELGAVPLVGGLLLGLVLVGALQALLGVMQRYLLLDFSVQFDSDLSLQLYRHALLLPGDAFDKERVGNVLVRLQSIEVIRSFLSSESLGAAFGLLTIVGSAAVLFSFAPLVGGVALGMVALLLLVQLASRRMLQRLHEQEFGASREATSVLSEMIGSIATVKATNAERAMARRFEAPFLAGVRARRTLQNRLNDVQLGSSLIGSIGLALALTMAGVVAIQGGLSPGEILAIGIYVQSMFAPVEAIGSLVSSLMELRVAVDKLGGIFERELEEPAKKAIMTHAVELHGKIRLDGVGFRYGASSPLVIKNLSVTIYPSQVVAIVGRSGSGKSTLAKLIYGELRPTSGRIYYDQFDGSVLSRACLRREMGVVEQGYALFAGDIRDNIALADDAPEETQIQEAARLSDAARFVDELPGAYAHRLGPRGLGLSGGQRQRLAIARALYTSPSVLVLDEALSSLDAHAEASIRENMREIAAGRTIILIAHRISTVKQADRILVIDDGALVEDGDHPSLLAKGGFYATLFAGQEDAAQARVQT